jgi:excisionase family DNA binding protein
MERLLKPRELGEILGFSTDTVLDWFEAKKIPGFKIGTAVRFRLSEVEDWLEAKRAGAGGEARTAPSKHPPSGVVSLTRTVPLQGGEEHA